jgi:ATP-dependent DNA helicase 2 subunit 1
LAAGGNDEDTVLSDDVCEGFEQVIAEMRIREMPKRAMWSVPMEVADGLTIGVKGSAKSAKVTVTLSRLIVICRYGLVTEQKKPHYKYMSASGATTEEVVSKTVYYDKVCHFAAWHPVSLSPDHKAVATTNQGI